MSGDNGERNVPVTLDDVLKRLDEKSARTEALLTRVEGKIDALERHLQALVFDTMAEEARIEREIGKVAAELQKVEHGLDKIDHDVQGVDQETHALEKIAASLASQMSRGSVRSCPKCGSDLVYRPAGEHAYLGVCNACGWSVMLPKEAVQQPLKAEVLKDEKPMRAKGDDSVAPSALSVPHDWTRVGGDD